LSGRARAVAGHAIDDNSWQFIHGRSAQTNVRSMPQVHTKHRGTWCQQRHWQSSVANDSAARECPQLPQRRNCTGPDPKSRQSASTGPATTWPALAPTLAAEDWQFIHNPSQSPAPQQFGAPAVLAPHLTLRVGTRPLPLWHRIRAPRIEVATHRLSGSERNRSNAKAERPRADQNLGERRRQKLALYSWAVSLSLC